MCVGERGKAYVVKVRTVCLPFERRMGLFLLWCHRRTRSRGGIGVHEGGFEVASSLVKKQFLVVGGIRPLLLLLALSCTIPRAIIIVLVCETYRCWLHGATRVAFVLPCTLYCSDGGGARH